MKISRSQKFLLCFTKQYTTNKLYPIENNSIYIFCDGYFLEYVLWILLTLILRLFCVFLYILMSIA